MRPRRVFVLSAAVLAVVAFSYTESGQAPGRLAPAAPPQVRTSDMPTPFVPNLGQWAFPAGYAARLGGMDLFVEGDGWLLAVTGEGADAGSGRETGPSVRGAAVRMRFAGAGDVTPTPEDLLPGVHSYFYGNDPTRWKTNVPRYGAVRFPGVWPGVDVLCYSIDGHLEYDIVLAPGMDLGQIELEVEGAEALRIDGQGALMMETAVGPIRQTPPRTYELDPEGRRLALEVCYELRGPDRFGFLVPGWSGEGELVLDPGLIWSTYIGGDAVEQVDAVHAANDGITTIAGRAKSLNYPTTLGAFSMSHTGTADFNDVVVSRLAPSQVGTAQLVFSTYLGGDHNDEPTALWVDHAGIVTVTGFATGHLSVPFPTTPDAYDPFQTGGTAFISRLDPSKTGPQQLVYSTFFGDGGRPRALHVDPAGVITIAGQDLAGKMPITLNAHDPSFNGGNDVFVARLDPSRAVDQLLYSTYLGGNSDDWAVGVSVDAAGIITLAGRTQPGATTSFPVTGGAYDTTSNGFADSFVVRLDPSVVTPPDQLVYSTLVGGSGREECQAMAVDQAGVVTITGWTESGDYPSTPDAFDGTIGGIVDAFITQIDPSQAGAAQLVYSTYLGGSIRDEAYQLAVDAAGWVTVCGFTQSVDFPTTPGSYSPMKRFSDEMFVSRLDPSAHPTQQMLYSTYFGGDDRERALALWVDQLGYATIAGFTLSVDYPVSTDAYRTVPLTATPGLQTDAVVSRLTMLPIGVDPVGDASPGVDGPPSIAVTKPPRTGEMDFAITCTHATPNSMALVVIGSAGLAQPFPVLGVNVWVDPASVLLAGFLPTDARGSAKIAIPIPNLPGLVGARVYAQFGAIGPSAPPPGPVFGVSATTGLEITVQS